MSNRGYQAVSNTVEVLANRSAQKLALWKRSSSALGISSVLGGAYVGIGVVLIFVLGSQVPEPWRKLVMGGGFGIALILVVIAGADLFTGHHLQGTLSALTKRTMWRSTLGMWAVCWLGNLAGATLLAGLITLGGGSGLHDSANGLLQHVAAYKMQSPPAELLARAALCNWLVCLALWMSARVDSDAARCMVISWCLFAFVACGFEHSVANMTLMTLALFGPHGADISGAGLAYNLACVSAGNAVGGGLFVAFAYWSIARSEGGAEPAEGLRDTVSRLEPQIENRSSL